MEEFPKLWPQVFGAIVCSTVYMSAGVVYGFTGITLPSLMNHESEDIILSTTEASIFSSVANVGAIFGSGMSGIVNVWFGQRSSFLIFFPIGIVSWVILWCSNAFWLLLASRILQGLVIGATIGSASSYVTEFAHSTIRGRLLALSSFSLQNGIFMVYLLGSTTITWRNVGLICGMTTMVIPLFGMLFLPSSPRWLVIRGRVEEAEKALTFFRGDHYNVTPELKEIIKKSSTEKTTVKNQFKSLMERAMFRRFMVISILLFSTHFTGHFAMITYSVSIFQSANVSINSYLSTILASITRIFGIFFYFLLADKLGRKRLYISSQLLAGFCSASVGIFFYLQQTNVDVSTISWLPVTSLICFTMFSCISNSVLAVWQSELLSNSARALGICLLYIVFYIGTFCASFSYHFMVASFGSHWTFWLYGVVSLMMTLIAVVTIPETKGKTLEEI